MAVLLLAHPTFSAPLASVALMGALIVLAAALGPVLSWVASAKGKRMVRAAALSGLAATVAAVLIVNTCPDWMWVWLCLAF